MIFVVLFVMVVLISTSSLEVCARKMTVTPNPGCGNCTDADLRLLQIELTDVDSSSVIHMLSSFGPPTLLTAHFNVTANVDVDWSCLKNALPRCIKFRPEPGFVSTIAINRLIEYDDESDASDVTAFSKKPDSVRSTYLTKVKWQPVAADKYTEPRWKFYLNETNDDLDLVNKNSTSAFLAIDFNFFNEQARSSIMPGILHTDSAAMFDVVMENMTTHFNSSRFAFEIVTVDNALPGTSEIAYSSSVDDEYSPGVFQTVTWTLNSDATATAPSTYIHYKPVSYTKEERNLESIQPAHISKIRFFNYDDLKATSPGLAYAYFGDDVRLKNVQSANFSIGSLNDGFYVGYNYTTFTAVCAVGQPVYDSMSAEVIVAISVGVGVPAILIILSVVIVLYRMMKKRSAESPSKPLILNNDSITSP